MLASLTGTVLFILHYPLLYIVDTALEQKKYDQGKILCQDKVSHKNRLHEIVGTFLELCYTVTPAQQQASSHGLTLGFSSIFELENTRH